MKTLELKKAKGSLATYARALGDEPMAVVENGKPVMVLLPVEGVDLETVSMSLNPRFIAILQRSRASCRPGEGISSEEMRRRLSLRHRAERKAG